MERIMMRHDLFWFNKLPVVRAWPSATRLWLPFNCATREVKLTTRKKGPSNIHSGENNSSATMISVASVSTIFGHKCNLQRPSPDQLGFCDQMIQIDWYKHTPHLSLAYPSLTPYA